MGLQLPSFGSQQIIAASNASRTSMTWMLLPQGSQCVHRGGPKRSSCLDTRRRHWRVDEEIGLQVWRSTAIWAAEARRTWLHTREDAATPEPGSEFLSSCYTRDMRKS